MSTMTMNKPFFCVDNNEKRNNYSMNLSKTEYTKTDTANILKNDEERIIRLFYKILTNYQESSINARFLGEYIEKIYYTKKKICYNNITFEFNIDFIYEIYKDISENLYIAQNEFFNICGYGDTAKEAEQDLYNTLYELWQVYAEENDDNLDNKAKKIKKKLITSVRKLN